jgi:hypothetical protein
MEFLYGLGILLLVYIGVPLTLVATIKLIKAIANFLKTRKYKAKLKKLTPQIYAIDIDELSSKLTVIKQSYLLLDKLLQEDYVIRDKEEQKSIDQYVQEEAHYRKSIRRPTKKSRRRKYTGYRRYY